MRKLFLIPLVVLAALVVYGASGGFGGIMSFSTASDPVIVIGEKLFVTQLEDMAVNIKSYEGRIVRVEGFTLLLRQNTPGRFAVARNFYCCGPDGYPVGLPCKYSGETPKNDSWIEVEGKLRANGRNSPYLEVVKLTVKATPGQRNVFS